MIIRLLNKNDYMNYINLIKNFRPIQTEITEKEFEELYDKIFTNSEIFVAETGNNLVGTLTIIYEQKFIHNCAKYGHIEDVFVDYNYRGKKIGSKLISKALKSAKELSCFKCTLCCNHNVKDFYLNNQFEERGINMSYLIENK
jgi:glucosamine-phosphate N-acetyltransferase